MKWTAKEFMIFSGTDANSWVKNHAYAILNVKDLSVGKVVQVRNPWGHNKWKGKFSEDDPTSYSALKQALGSEFKEEAGKFWMSYEDFLLHFSRIYMAHSQEKRNSSSVERTEWRQTIELPKDTEQQLRLTLFQDVDLTQDVFGFNLIQGGNRIGTARNPAVQKMETAYFRWRMEPMEAGNASWNKSWHGHGVHPNMWDLGDGGNNHLFTETASDKKIPKGAYLINIKPEWKYSNLPTVLKQMRVRAMSPQPFVLETLSTEQAGLIATDGYAKMSTAGQKCSLYNSRKLSGGSSLKAVAKAAHAAGKTAFAYAPGTTWGAWWCAPGDR